MPDIRNKEFKGDVEEWIKTNYQAIRDNIKNKARDSGAPQQVLDSIQSLEIGEIIVYGEYGRTTNATLEPGEYPLKAILSLIVDGHETSKTNVYKQFAKEIYETFNDIDELFEVSGSVTPTQELLNEFSHIEISLSPSDRIDGAIKRYSQGQQDEMYSLTRDENIIISGGSIERKPAGVVEPASEEEDVNTDSTDIAEYPDKRDLIDEINTAFNEAKEYGIDEYPEREEYIFPLLIDDLVVIGEWGNGDAEFGVDDLDVVVFIKSSGETPPESIPTGSRIFRDMSNYMTGHFDAPGDLELWAPNQVFRILPSNGEESFIESNIENPETGSAYSLTHRVKYKLEEVRPGTYNVVAEGTEEIEEQIQQEKGEKEVEEGQEEQQPEQVEQEQEETEEEEEIPEKYQLTEEEVMERRYPEIPKELHGYIEERERLAIPINKKTKWVEPRDPYDFEIDMMEGFENEDGITVFYENTMAYSKASGDYGVEQPASSFPRVGGYTKRYLHNRGASFLNQIYKDLVIYSAFLSERFDQKVEVMTYHSYTEYINRLKLIHERGGPKLINYLSQQQAAARGLRTIPKLPSGQEAPWLERRTYIDVVEENFDSDIWVNPATHLYEEDEQ